MFVLRQFVEAGADEDICYSVGAHLGTDRLKTIVKKIRGKIISLGGEFRFNTRFDYPIIKNGRVVGAVLTPKSDSGVGAQISSKNDKAVGAHLTLKNDSSYELYSDKIILAIGHSARDTFRALRALGIKMTPRPFGIGLRVEHPREYINELVYGKKYPSDLGTASYHLVTHLENGRSVYSFCMCPGGEVVAATGNEGCVETNGMSEYSRMADNSNAAYLVSVTPDDFESDDPLAGFILQEKIERRAFALGGEDYRAPVTRMEEFLKNQTPTSLGATCPSYKRGTKIATPDEYLPDFITDSLRNAVYDFDAWMPGILYPDSPMTGPETRTTSPVRINRNELFICENLPGLYPVGEGAGYAGGIVSSARDGVMAAVAILKEKQ